MNSIKLVEPLFTIIKNNSKKTFYNHNSLLNTFSFFIDQTVKKKNAFEYYDNLSPSEQKKYKTPPHSYFNYYSSKDAYSKKHHFNKEYYNNFVKPYKLTYNLVINAIALGREFNIFRIHKGKWGYDCSQVWINDPIEWRINAEDFPLKTYLQIIAPYYKQDTDKPSAILRDKSKDATGNLLPYDKRSRKYKKVKNNFETPCSKDTIAEVDKINAGLPKQLQYTRVFGKTENEYGRLFGILNRLSKRLRAKICNMYDLTEIDFTNFNVNLFYLIANGKKYEGDFYNDIMKSVGIPEDEYSKHRKTFKKLCLCIFGTENKTHAQQSVMSTLMKEHLFLKPKEIVEAIEKQCPEIKDYIFNPITSIAQRMESKIIITIANEMLKDNLMPFLIHDSFIVPKEYAKKYDRLMEKVLLDVVQKNRKNIINEIKIRNSIKNYKNHSINCIINNIPIINLNKLIQLNYSINRLNQLINPIIQLKNTYHSFICIGSFRQPKMKVGFDFLFP